MALTFATGMTMDQNMTAEAATNWAVARISGSGQAPSSSLDQSVYKQGAASMSAKIANNSTDACLLYDYYTDHTNAVLNLNTGNRHLLLWVLCTSISAIETLANGGMYILLQSSTETGTTAPTRYAKFYIHGNATYKGGWIAVLIDPAKTPSIAVGAGWGGSDLAVIRRVGVGLKTLASVPTIKAENLFVDAIRYGKPLYAVKGDGATTATWADFLSNSNTDANGLIEDLGGAYAVSCGIRFGDAAQTATTTFADATGKQIIYKRHTYYQAAVVDVVDYTNVYVVDAQGATSYRTSVTMGSAVGAGDARQGVLGGAIRSADNTNITWKADFSTDKVDLSAVKLYGMTLSGAKGGVLLDNDTGATETDVISCQFVNCGEINPGTTGNGATILSSFVIDPLGGTATNRGLRMNSLHNIKKVNCITSGAPTTQHMIHMPTAGTYSITFNGIIFYGDYSSGTLWHGENSSTNGSAVTQTLSLTTGSGSNPTVSEFDVTGTNITVATETQLPLTVLVVDKNNNPIPTAQTAIHKTSDNSQLMNQDTRDITAGAFVVGTKYIITFVGTTDFTLIGASANTVGIVFTATGAGSGTGTASDGIATTTFTQSPPVDIYLRIRKSSPGATKYVPASTTGTIGDSGYSTKITLQEDPNA